MKYIGTASRTARPIMPRMTFRPMLDLGLNPEACIRTVEGPLCPPPGWPCETERSGLKPDNQPVVLRAMDCAVPTAPFFAVVCPPVCAGVLAAVRATPCAVDRMSAWLVCLATPLSALIGRAA